MILCVVARWILRRGGFQYPGSWWPVALLVVAKWYVAVAPVSPMSDAHADTGLHKSSRDRVSVYES